MFAPYMYTVPQYLAVITEAVLVGIMPERAEVTFASRGEPFSSCWIRDGLPYLNKVGTVGHLSGHMFRVHALSFPFLHDATGVCLQPGACRIPPNIDLLHPVGSPYCCVYCETLLWPVYLGSP